MKTLCRVYDSYGQARAAVDAVEKAGVPASDVSIVANKGGAFSSNRCQPVFR